jgi:RNA polymerase sigma factor (sigma-70 family)
MSPQQALAQIFESDFERIYRFFYLKTFSKEDAEDLTSETFIALAKAISNNKEVGDLRDYLYGIARNVFNTHLRKRYQLPTVSLDELPEIAEEIEISVGKEYQLESIAIKLIDQLPEKQQLVLKLRLIEKKTLTEICLTLKKDMNYVKTTQKRALHKLKEIIACTPLSTYM